MADPFTGFGPTAAGGLIAAFDGGLSLVKMTAAHLNMMIVENVTVGASYGALPSCPFE